MAGVAQMLIAAIATFGSLLFGAFWLWRRAAAKAEQRRAQQWQAFASAPPPKGAELPPLVASACADAGLRAVECDLCPHSHINDPVARKLCGKYGWAYGQTYLGLMMDQEGTGKSSQVAGRARLLDDDLAFALAALAHADPDAEAVQVVCLGCGMDTRPWRLRRGAGSRGAGGAKLLWYEVDHPSVIEHKQQALQDGGLLDGQPSASPAPGRTGPGLSAGGRHKEKRGQALVLAVDELKSVGCDLAGGEALEGPLQKAGYSPAIKTVWVAEAYLYRLPLHRTAALLRECSRLSGPGSRLLATLVSPALVKACASADGKTSTDYQHSHEQLLAPGVLEGTGWGNAVLSGGIGEVCRTRYKVECYPPFGRFAWTAGVSSLSDVEHVLTASHA